MKDRNREASTSPTTSAIKTVQNILATLQAGQMSLNQLLALQTSHQPLLPPWALPHLPLPGLGLADSPGVQQLYLQQSLHSLLPPGYQQPHNNTIILQNQVSPSLSPAFTSLTNISLSL